jgi:two-component system response regulator FixJ
MDNGASVAGGWLIAIVDDEAAVRVGLRRFCLAAGMRATVYSSGRELIEAIQSAAWVGPDCLLLDSHMPDMTGLEVLQHLIRHGARFPVLAYSAADEPEAIDRYVEAGAVAYLRKPILGEHLIAAMERAIGAAPARALLTRVEGNA